VARGPDVIVLACTEIPVVIKQDDVSVPIIDSTDALARHCIAAAQDIQTTNRQQSGRSLSDRSD